MTVHHDLGNGHSYSLFTHHGPDELNPNALPAIDPLGAIITHADGCQGAINFDVPGARELLPKYDLWQLISLEPLHVEPSILRQGAKNGTDHNHHGFIRGGRWESCSDDGAPVAG